MAATDAENEGASQKHFLCTIVGPDSSYSCLEIHICWNVLNEDRMEPPIHTEYLRSGGAMTLIFMVDGARAVSSFVMRSPMPGNIVVPPDRTTFAYGSLRMSTSHFMIDWNVVSWTPLASLPMKLGWNNTSGQRKRSFPTVIRFPSGSSYVFSFSELSAAAFISVSKSSATYESFSFTSRTISRSAVVVNEYPRSVRIFMRYSVRSRPARSRQSIAFIDWHCVGNTITRIHDNSGGAARSIERKNSLDSHIHGRRIEGLEHDLCHALAIGLWIQRSLGEEDWMLLRCHTQLIVESMVPDLLHVIPVSHDAMLDWVLQSQHTTLTLCLVANVAVLLVHANHDARHLWAAHDGWEDGTWCIIACEPALHMPLPLSTT